MSTQGVAAQSLVTFRNSQGAEARGTLLKLTRSTIVFEVYNPYSIVQLSEVLQDLVLRRRDKVIYRGKAVVSHLLNTGLMMVVSATLVDTWSDLWSWDDLSSHLGQEVNTFIEEWKDTDQIQPGYRLAVNRLRSFLSELSQWLGQLDITNDDGQLSSVVTEDKFESLASPTIRQMDELFAQFEDEAAQVSPEEEATYKAFAQRDLLSLMMRSPFFHRAFTKPLGYAGDYQMVSMMLRSGMDGPSTYAQLINAYYHRIGPTRAHRNRIAILIKYLSEIAAKAANEERPAQILNIGCGPAVEVRRFVRDFPLAGRCNIKLLDFNDETIRFAEDEISKEIIAARSDMQTEYELKSVHALLKQASITGELTEIDKYDFIYCAGLFDYLSDKVCARLLRLFYKWTKPGGAVLATNVHPDNPSKWTMEHIVEWHLIHRDAKDMGKLIPDLGRQKVFLDATGYNVFLDIQKPLVTRE